MDFFLAGYDVSGVDVRGISIRSRKEALRGLKSFRPWHSRERNLVQAAGSLKQ